MKKLFSKPLATDFYRRNTIGVAHELLGKMLLVQSDAGFRAGRIVETEAYRGDDPASHSCRGKTPRNLPMFGEPGFAYVYFIYGMYEMLNFVTEPKGFPGAVLIRAVEPLSGVSLSTNGPGKLCRAMGIQMLHNGQSLQGPSLVVSDDGFRPRRVLKSPRVGIRVGLENLWRFFIQDHPQVSRVPQNRVAVAVRDSA